MRKPYQSPGRMKNSSYYIAPVGVRTHDLPHTVASNMVKVSHALNHSATEAVKGVFIVSSKGHSSLCKNSSNSHHTAHNFSFWLCFSKSRSTSSGSLHHKVVGAVGHVTNPCCRINIFCTGGPFVTGGPQARAPR